MAPLRLRLLCLASTALVAWAISASPATAAQWRGVQVSPFWASEPAGELDRQLDLARSAGANVVRVNLSWSSLQEVSSEAYSSWYVARADALFQAAARRGLRVAPNLWSSPCWASSAPDRLKQGCSDDWWDRGVTRYPPSDPEAYARTAAWVASRWGAQMAGLEIWNEPNHIYLTSEDQARDYARLVKTAYPAIKATRPDLPVIAGGLSGADASFVSKLYDNGIAGSFDVFSIHPYSGDRHPSLTADGNARIWSFASGVPWVRETMVARGDPKPLWLSEFGWTSCTAPDSRCVSESAQAAYTRDAWRMIADWGYVHGATQYQLRNNGTDPSERESNFGLLREDLSPKPAYEQLSAALHPLTEDVIGRPFVLAARARPRQPMGALTSVELRIRCSEGCRLSVRPVLPGEWPLGLRLQARSSSGYAAQRARRTVALSTAPARVQVALPSALRRRAYSRGRPRLTLSILAESITRRSQATRRVSVDLPGPPR